MAQALKLAPPTLPPCSTPTAIAGELAKLAASYPGRERELRTAVAQRLKAALAASRAEIERLLLKDRHGGRCAARLCWVQDEVIRVLYRVRRQAPLSVGEPVGEPSAWRSSPPAATAAA